MGWVGNDKLTHEFFKLLFALFVDEIGDFTSYLLKERPTMSTIARKVFKP